MVDRDVIAAKLAVLADRIARAKSHCPSTVAALAADRDSMDLVAFNLMLALQSCLDIASHVIGDERWPTVSTMAAAFQRLAEHGVIAQPLADEMGRAAGLRNIVAHGYAGIDPQVVHRAATQGIGDLESFARAIAAWTTAHSSG